MRFILACFLIFNFSFANLQEEQQKSQNQKILNELSLDDDFIESQSFLSNFHKLEKYYKDKTHKGSNYIFMPTINKVLVENGVPKSLLYLAVAESRLIPDAASNKKAVGVWQLIPEAAKYHGLKIDKFVDERYDIEKSSEIASAYLGSLYAKFGKWYLAAAAYNGGPARVAEGVLKAKIDIYCKNNDCKNDKQIASYNKTIKKYKAKKVTSKAITEILEETNEWDIDVDMKTMLSREDDGKSGKYLPTESLNFIETIVSLAMIDAKYNLLTANSAFSNRSLTRLTVNGVVSMKTIAKQTSINYDDFKSLNRHIKGDKLKVNKEYSIYIPSSRVAKYNKANNILSEENYFVYQIKENDTIKKISSVYGVDSDRLLSINYLDNMPLIPSQKIVIPVEFEPNTNIHNKLALVSNLWE